MERRDHIAAHLEWCWAFIEHNCILRLPPGQPLLVNFDKGLGNYQYFAQIATLDQEFSRRISLLFWDHYLEQFKQQPFQLCGCETGGVPLICALQSAGLELGVNVNVFSVKKKQKTYGLKNWCEGIILENLPVLLVDDVIGGLLTMRAQAKRLLGLGLQLTGAFAIAACKPDRSPALEVEGKYLFDVFTFYKPEDFTPKFARYVAKYGKQPQFFGARA
jgi:orotate phosphoribosyltransferase